MDEYDFQNWPIKKSEIDPFLDQSCKILNIPKSFREKNINENLKIIEFQESEVRFHERYFEHIKRSKFINLSLNCIIFNIKMSGNTVTVFLKSQKNISIKTNFLVLACGGIENSRLLLWFRENNKEISKNFRLEIIGWSILLKLEQV